MSRIIRVFLVIVLCLLSRSVFAQSDEPPVKYVYDKDETMNRAILDARQTIDHFHSTLLSGNTDSKYFSLKMKMQAKRKIEHIWLANIEYKDGQYTGVVDNVPLSIKNVKMGDTLNISNADITDWFYIEDGKLYGGYTIRVLRDKMSEKERRQFDENFPVTY